MRLRRVCQQLSCPTDPVRNVAGAVTAAFCRVWGAARGNAAVPFALSIAACGAASAEEYRHFSWEEVASGVWFGLVLPDSFQTGNVAIVTLPGGGSLVVDTQDSEFLGREILEKAKEVGKGSVKYVVNTHLHQDHIGGNIASAATIRT
jgi:glyoxylase-like metal-dependent hydrolase (beta-lactamase superfamily II)